MANFKTSRDGQTVSIVTLESTRTLIQPITEPVKIALRDSTPPRLVSPAAQVARWGLFRRVLHRAVALSVHLGVSNTGLDQAHAMHAPRASTIICTTRLRARIALQGCMRVLQDSGIAHSAERVLGAIKLDNGTQAAASIVCLVFTATSLAR